MSLDSLLKNSEEYFNELIDKLNPSDKERFKNMPFSRIIDLINEREEKNDTCPECKNKLFFDSKTGNLVCRCGYVADDSLSEAHFSGQQRRGYDKEQYAERTINQPVSKIAQELNIGEFFNPSHFNGITPQKKAQFYHLQKIEARTKLMAKERNYSKSYGKMKNIVSKLNLPEDVFDFAWQIYKETQKKGLVRGRSIDGCVSASVHLATRLKKFFRFPEEIYEIFSLDRSSFDSDVKDIFERIVRPVFKMKYPLVKLPSVIAYCLGSAKLDSHIKPCIEIYKQLLKNGFRGHGRDPTGVSSAIVYFYGNKNHVSGIETQEKVSDLFRVTQVTLRNTLKVISKFNLEQILDN